MNANTKEALQAFIQAILNFGHTVSALSNNTERPLDLADRLRDLIKHGTALSGQLDHDETIP